jgi:UDP-N-acetylglucosamine:LPS N-acetylglucosamine transferase
MSSPVPLHTGNQTAWHNCDVARLDFIYFDAGGGHRAAANALRQVVESQGREFQIRMVNLQEVLDEIDVFRKLTGLRLQDLYNVMLKRGWTLGSPQLTAGMHLVIRMFHKKQVRVLERFWAKDRPDLIVSMVPNLNRAMFHAAGGIPMVTILTDIADYPPHFWIERQEQYLICGSSRAAEQAREHGYPPERIERVSGMILNPAFYHIEPISPEDRARAQAELKLDPARPVGLVLFGGEGSAAMEEIARRLDTRQLILICGKNEKLAAKLRAMSRSAPAFVEGFTREVPRYMQLADYFIGKPGPGSLSEAMAMRLPVIVERNAWTLPQERYNAEWIREHGVGLVLPNFRGIAGAVDELLEPAAYERFRAATDRLSNRAVFEIPEILERILARHRA